MKNWFQKLFGGNTAQNLSSDSTDVSKIGKDSDAPWVDVTGTVTSDGRIALEADWNDAFIVFLRGEGLNGANDEAIVQQYIAIMHRQLMSEDTNFE